MTTRLLVATHNQGKVHEYADMLADLNVEWVGLDDVGVTEDVAETGNTFLENAILKAEAYARETGLLTLADDSGLVVDALDGAPGVFTARYGGAGLSSEARYRYLLKQLEAVPWEQRTARFVCVVALGESGALLAQSEGVCEGRIAFEPAGNNGFGYDPVFFVERYGATMAELPPAVKHTISHRGRALEALAPQLMALLAS